jgi:hypothetical protein
MPFSYILFSNLLLAQENTPRLHENGKKMLDLCYSTKEYT